MASYDPSIAAAAALRGGVFAILAAMLTGGVVALILSLAHAEPASGASLADVHDRPCFGRAADMTCENKRTGGGSMTSHNRASPRPSLNGE